MVIMLVYSFKNANEIGRTKQINVRFIKLIM